MKIKRGDHVTTDELFAYLDIASIDELLAWRAITDTGQRRLDPVTGELEIVWRNHGIVPYQRALKSKRLVAYHEAGHAVVRSVVGGRKVSRIFVTSCTWSHPNRGFVGYSSHATGRGAKAKDREIVVSLAGPIAQLRYSPYSHWRDLGREDFENVSRLIGGDDRWRRDAQARTEQLVTEHWDKITRLAKALSENVRDTVMSGEEMEAILSEDINTHTRFQGLRRDQGSISALV